ncbi:hypothetical protein [Streptomyces orinoci]|uniref:Uncharacterized protein n=1 Tax=Streptomyces orinoci TaxID=67339 RepID=A0ABV3JQV1_STRON|nr:hypothetical protein [Streptomyces orinoci]
MLSVRSALCGALTLLAFGAVPAHALDEPYIRVGAVDFYPVASRPGSEVKIRVSGCMGERATAVSEALVARAPLARDAIGHVADATVRSDVRPGSYPVRIDCDGHDGVARGELTVVEHDGRDRHHHEPDSYPAPPGREDAREDGREDGGREDSREDDFSEGEHERHEGRMPVAPEPAGGGGAARMAPDDAPGMPGLIVGGTGVLIAGGLIWHRRRGNAADGNDTGKR